MARVKRPSEYGEMLKKLSSGDSRVFNSMKDALVFAACLGYERERRVSFEKSDEPIDMSVFGGRFDENLFHLIVVGETKDVNAMGKKGESDRLKVFEEYACGGLEIMAQEIYNQSADWDILLMGLVTKQESGESKKIDNISELIGEDSF